jgi:hypothetical protein
LPPAAAAPSPAPAWSSRALRLVSASLSQPTGPPASTRDYRHAQPTDGNGRKAPDNEQGTSHTLEEKLVLQSLLVSLGQPRPRLCPRRPGGYVNLEGRTCAHGCKPSIKLTENAAATHRLQLRELEMQYVVPKNTHFRNKSPMGKRDGRRKRDSRDNQVSTLDHIRCHARQQEEDLTCSFVSLLRTVRLLIAPFLSLLCPY